MPVSYPTPQLPNIPQPFCNYSQPTLLYYCLERRPPWCCSWCVLEHGQEFILLYPAFLPCFACQFLPPSQFPLFPDLYSSPCFLQTWHGWKGLDGGGLDGHFYRSCITMPSFPGSATQADSGEDLPQPSLLGSLETGQD